MDSSDSDTTAVNPKRNDLFKTRVMTPDPMRPHSLYDPDESPSKYLGSDGLGPILSRK